MWFACLTRRPRSGNVVERESVRWARSGEGVMPMKRSVGRGRKRPLICVRRVDPAASLREVEGAAAERFE